MRARACGSEYGVPLFGDLLEVEARSGILLLLQLVKLWWRSLPRLTNLTQSGSTDKESKVCIDKKGTNNGAQQKMCHLEGCILAPAKGSTGLNRTEKKNMPPLHRPHFQNP